MASKSDVYMFKVICCTGSSGSMLNRSCKSKPIEAIHQVYSKVQNDQTQGVFIVTFKHNIAQWTSKNSILVIFI